VIGTSTSANPCTEDKSIAQVTGQPLMTVQEFVTLHRDAFNAVSTAG